MTPTKVDRIRNFMMSHDGWIEGKELQCQLDIPLKDISRLILLNLSDIIEKTYHKPRGYSGRGVVLFRYAPKNAESQPAGSEQ